MQRRWHSSWWQKRVLSSQTTSSSSSPHVLSVCWDILWWHTLQSFDEAVLLPESDISESLSWISRTCWWGEVIGDYFGSPDNWMDKLGKYIRIPDLGAILWAKISYCTCVFLQDSRLQRHHITSRERIWPSTSGSNQPDWLFYEKFFWICTSLINSISRDQCEAVISPRRGTQSDYVLVPVCASIDVGIAG